jgi:hypothetical protein
MKYIDAQPIKLYKAIVAFLKKKAHTVTVVQRPDGNWMFTFILEEGDQPEFCTLLKQKGEVRTWIDPRNLFAFLKERFNVDSGEFKLSDE